jgi:Arc/MetJ-type ribon-helix-helix transcriptional regulator
MLNWKPHKKPYMTIHLQGPLQADILAAVHSGRYASLDDAMADAASLLVQRLKQEQAEESQITRQTVTEMKAGIGRPAAEMLADRQEQAPSSHELQRRLLEAGIISEIKPPITDLTPYQNRRAVPIQGEPISETAIRERR